MKYCQNCGRMHEGPLWETFLDGDNEPLEMLLCSEPRYKEDDETKEDDNDEETPSKPEGDKHKGYKEEDIENDDFGHMQRPFTSTDISYAYTHKTNPGSGLFNLGHYGPREVELIAKIENVFEQSNAVHLKYDALYPDLFTRNWSLGTKFHF